MAQAQDISTLGDTDSPAARSSFSQVKKKRGKKQNSFAMYAVSADGYDNELRYRYFAERRGILFESSRHPQRRLRKRNLAGANGFSLVHSPPGDIAKATDSLSVDSNEALTSPPTVTTRSRSETSSEEIQNVSIESSRQNQRSKTRSLQTGGPRFWVPTLRCYAAPAGRMKIVLLIMTGIGFTLGVVFGLLLQLPIDTLPADTHGIHSQNSFSAPSGPSRTRRSLLHGNGENTRQPALDLGKLHAQRDAEKGRSSEKGVAKLDLMRKPTGVLSSHQESGVKNDSLAGVSKVQLRKNTGRSSNNAGAQAGPKAGNLRFNPRQSPSSFTSLSQNNALVKEEGAAGDKIPLSAPKGSTSLEDLAYLATLVQGISWSPRLEASCPRPFSPSEVDAWRQKTSSVDVVKVEEGCGRMQNRLITFRDSSRACARYRLNTDQIQGEVFSYYLARLLNVSHIPPTALARVDSLSSRWRSVHLQLSLAQWADSKLVVLTKYIDGMSPSHIPPEFRGEGEDTFERQGSVSHFKVESSTGGDKDFQSLVYPPPQFRPKLTPTVFGLGTKSRPELCQLLQWSDLIVFDYLTANLDRVINNMFNRQWNDQMMASPAHNLEQRQDGALVFLDNESGLFHGYRLLDKYAGFHRSLLGALCVFRPSTVNVVKRLRASQSVGKELQELFVREEPELHEQLAPLPEKNVKVLQQRLQDVYAQIVACEKVYGGADGDSSSYSKKFFSHR
ncbi:four-jointed box protein [Elysia marginata]|uniref:Four-jointed box protein n=1 Tax=Elysia marginata TaxID=1093978 RepID=A0AAV4GA50_9GAST|nr:four-jointed box protein [Elysia marginata]